ncbi:MULTISPECIES: S10 family peptidase [Nocardioides]|uniref:S10 family peptidase n=1 Tax=Nocardioides vastitatis TaxID=2568655 RepID=A0ABW0ZIM7_9ACTN|nr:S10 family peptidase [Nocardioides sp.]
MIAPPPVAPVEHLPGYGPVRGRQVAGYVPVSEAQDAHLYVWFIEHADAEPDAPIVLWLNGGPGSSSFLGLFAENGPYRIRPDGTLADNPFGWNTAAGYLMIDQPAGTGLSVVESPEAWARTEEEATRQLLYALQQLFDLLPDLRSRDLYLFGESFAGVYIPMLAHAILQSNDDGGSPIELKGIGVGDGWVDPVLQQRTYGAYAYAHGLIDTSQVAHVHELYGACAAAIERNHPASRQADRICNRIEAYITAVSGGANVYDVRMIGDYDFTPIGTYLDRPDVREALHVDLAAPAWADTSKRVGFLLEKGEQDSVAGLYPALFERLRVLIYNGVFDMDCNFMGTDAWICALDWSFRDEFLSTSRIPWLVDGVLAGRFRRARTLTQLLVDGAGHLVPMDQPQNALRLLEQFLGSGIAGDTSASAEPQPGNGDRLLSPGC